MRWQRFLVAACLAGAAAAAAADPVVFSSPRRGELLRAGADVEVRWSGVPSDAEEMELLLSLDGGRGIALRLTSELPARERSFSWRVPNLVSSRASLVLRVGSLGREQVVGTSAPFTIASDRSLGSETFIARSGELWLTSQPAPSDPLSPAGMSGQETGWTISGAAGRPASLSSSNLLPLPSRMRLSENDRAKSRGRVGEPAAAEHAPPPSPALRL